MGSLADWVVRAPLRGHYYELEREGMAALGLVSVSIHLQRSNLLASAGSSHVTGVTLEVSLGRRPKEQGAQHGKN